MRGIKVEYINPFVESVQDIFDSKLSCEVRRGELTALEKPGNLKDITAFIGLSGSVRGNVALAFPVTTAIRIASRLLDTEIRIVDELVSEAVSELVSVVAEQAKAKLSKQDEVINLTLPSVVRGSGFEIHSAAGTYWLSVPFDSEMGSFSLSVTLEDLR